MTVQQIVSVLLQLPYHLVTYETYCALLFKIVHSSTSIYLFTEENYMLSIVLIQRKQMAKFAFLKINTLNS